MSEKNRLLVNEGEVTIMINSRHPISKKVEYILRGLCCTIAGVDIGYDWDAFAEGMIELTHKLQS